eukprot:gnl/TRDRNA2_/TRDRNA2_93992_c0_seq1.p1 gnl/TRDRNA2_/TRDRNA2_93992_c0~~gnl/TRDRNA2_/TRDRNA2_93992_c0_seq1.p1  ORF type:complete len:152 (+),score=42.53 gnl/TRDRNA2_/TRDRNA2_93992_c0_seq1:51-506(+)
MRLVVVVLVSALLLFVRCQDDDDDEEETFSDDEEEKPLKTPEEFVEDHELGGRCMVQATEFREWLLTVDLPIDKKAEKDVVQKVQEIAEALYGLIDDAFDSKIRNRLNFFAEKHQPLLLNLDGETGMSLDYLCQMLLDHYDHAARRHKADL